MDSCFGENDRAVSPVIGVILMVGISVTLSTTIGVAILAHTNELDDTSPNVRLEITQDGDSFTIQHSGGERLSGDQLYYTLNGSFDRLNTTNKFNGEVNVGDTAQITLTDGETLSGNETFRVIWISESGRRSEILASIQT